MVKFSSDSNLPRCFNSLFVSVNIFLFKLFFKQRQKEEAHSDLTKNFGFDMSCLGNTKWKGDAMVEKVMIYGKAG